MSAPHDHFARQVQAYAAGLLDEARTLEMDAHVAGCAECRGALATLRPAAVDAAGHLPASLIATWSRSKPALGEPERSLIASHLQHCEQCRATLRFAGHEPVLEPATQPAPARKPVHGKRRAWGIAVWLAAGAAAAWFVVARVPVDPADRLGSATIGAASESALRLDLVAAEPAAAPRHEWPPAGEASPLTLPAAAIAAGVSLPLPPEVGALRGGEVTLSLFGPSGALLAIRPLPRDSSVVGLRPVALQLHGAGSVRAGHYRLRFVVAPDSGAPVTLDRTLAVE